MKYLILLQIFGITSFVSLAEVLTSQKGYIFTSPRVLNTDASNELHMQLFGVDEPTTLNVQVLYKKDEDSPNETVAADKTFLIPAGENDVILHLLVDKVPPFVYESRIQINGTNSDISGSDKVSIRKVTTSIIIIQTDKPLYQPGQTVKFRILRVNKFLKPFKDNKKSIVYIEDPHRTRLFQVTDLDLSQGVVQNEFHLSDEPVLGEWEITVDTDDDTRTVYFDVREYVLPKFDVNIKFPPYVLANAESFPVEICAKYTYGEPVIGTLHVHTSIENFYDQDKYPTVKQNVKIDGCYKYDVNVTYIEPDDHYSYQGIRVSAHVTEQGTGVKRESTQTLYRTIDPLKLAFKDQRGNFKFGLPYNGKLAVSHPDDSPAAGEPIEICEEVTENRIISDWSATKTYKMCKNYTSDENGIILYHILPRSIDVTSINLKAKSLKYPNPISTEERENSLEQPETSAYLTPFFSPTNSFIQIQPVHQPVPCEAKQNFTIYFTANASQDFKFYYQITKQTNIVVVDTKEKYFSPEDDISPEFFNDPKLLVSNRTYLNPSPEAIKKEDCPTTNKDQQLPFVGKLDLGIDIGPNLSPSFQLLIFYIKENRETVADSQDINVEQCFKNKVKFSFGDKVKKPSLPTAIKVQASPNSLCGIKAIDKSISLLNSGGKLTADKVFDNLRGLDNNEYSSSDPCSDKNVQPGLENSPYNYSILLPGIGANAYDDSLTAFQTSGFVVISNFLVFTRPCPTNKLIYDPVYLEERRISYEGFDDYEYNTEEYETAEYLDEEFFTEEGSGPSLVSAKGVRDYFPETWLFEMEMTGPDGVYQTQEQLPDTVTEWIGSAFCINSNDGLGVSNETSIKAFQPFFIDYTLPVSVVRKETFVITVSVFSYANEALPIAVSLINPYGFEIVSNGVDGVYCLVPDLNLNLNLTLKATKIGNVNLTVKAETADSPTACGGQPSSSAYARDAITKPIEVLAEGFPNENVINDLFCPSDHPGNTFEQTIEITVPNGIVSDSARAYLDLSGNVMGPAINNLKSLVRLPTGCGEQNMVKFTPNYVVLDYLNSTGQLTDELKSEAISNLNEGYQRELKFRHRDGSFSAFGETDDEGSMFLTAFVLRSFYQAQRYIFIDKYLIEDMQNWILDRQSADGCFQDVGRIIDIGLEGAVDDDKSPGSITAYVLASLILSDMNNQTILNGGFSCLEKYPPGNPYSQMLYAYAASLGGKIDDSQTYIDEARQRLNRTGGMDSFLIVNGTKAIEIETDAYAVLTTLNNGGSASDAVSYVRYLTNNLNPYGGFMTTQDTCVGLEALAKFSKIINKDPLDMSVFVIGGTTEQLQINDNNKLVVHRSKIPEVPNEIAIKATGTGCGLAQVSIRYNTESPPEKNKFAIDIKGECSFSGCKHATISGIVSYLPDDQKSGMSVAEIRLITGYVPNKGSLDSLQDHRRRIMKVDVQNNMVILYFSELSNHPTKFSFQVEQVIEVKDAQPGTAKVYDYYANENSDSTSYVIRGLNYGN